MPYYHSIFRPQLSLPCLDNLFHVTLLSFPSSLFLHFMIMTLLKMAGYLCCGRLPIWIPLMFLHD